MDNTDLTDSDERIQERRGIPIDRPGYIRVWIDIPDEHYHDPWYADAVTFDVRGHDADVRVEEWRFGDTSKDSVKAEIKVVGPASEEGATGIVRVHDWGQNDE